MADHYRPFKHLLRLLAEEKKDMWVLVAYTVTIGLLFLAVPLAAQALVNAIATGMMTQQLVVLTGAVLLGLLFAGVLRLLQISLVELIQQRLFVKTGLSISEQMLRVNQTALKDRYAPELVNRFFDILTIQKTIAKILLDGPAAFLQIGIGLLLMGVYSPLLLGFDVLFILAVIFIGLLGRKAIQTSLKESTQKYGVAQWLEELAFCQISFKMNGTPPYLLEETDRRLNGYLTARQKHFKIILRQATGNFLLQAIASAGLLAIGGWLVINQSLTLGQLVASEIIIVAVLSATDKLFQQLESFYDLLTGLEKVDSLQRLATEPQAGEVLPPNNQAMSIECHEVHFEYEPHQAVFEGLNFDIAAGERLSIVGRSGVGKTTLAHLLCGLVLPQSGKMLLNGIDIRHLKLNPLRQKIALVSGAHELFEGTVEQNITLGRPIEPEQLQWALDQTEMAGDLAQYSKGLNHRVNTAGYNLSLGQRHRILITRAIVEKPKLIILDEAFSGMDERTKLRIIEKLFSSDHPWTLINISHDAEVVARTPRVIVLADHQVVEDSLLKDCMTRPNSAFCQLFPELTQQLTKKL